MTIRLVVVVVLATVRLFEISTPLASSWSVTIRLVVVVLVISISPLIVNLLGSLLVMLVLLQKYNPDISYIELQDKFISPLILILFIVMPSDIKTPLIVIVSLLVPIILAPLQNSMFETSTIEPHDMSKLPPAICTSPFSDVSPAT